MTGTDDNKQPMDMTVFWSEWELCRGNRENYTRDFVDLDNLVDGIPLSHEKDAPYVGDTTIAGLVKKIPRDSLQQVPIFGAIVNGTKNSIKAAIASYLLRSNVFNQDTFGKGLLSTMQMGGEEAIKHGYVPFMTISSKILSEFGTTMKMLHYSDVDPETGIQDAHESGFWYVSANLPKSKVIKMRNAAKENPNTDWSVEALDELLEMEPEAKVYSIYESDARENNNSTAAGTYTFVTRYNVGQGGKFITACPQLKEKSLRTIKNRSKFGYPRINFLVIDPVPLSPYGLSRVRLASPNQNMMNVYLQSTARMLLINSDPPILKRGRFTKPVQLKRRAVWEAQDQNAKAELVTLDNGNLAQFVPMSQQMAAQIQNMMGSTKGGLNGNSNAFGYSKTGPGVKQQNRDEDASTNQITNIMENFLRQYGLVALDTMVSDQSGDDVLVLDDEAKNAINRIAKDKFEPEIDPMTLQPLNEFIPPVGDDNKIEINWEQYYAGIDSWSVEIELSIGKDELEEKTRADLQDMLTTMTQNADPNDLAKQQKIAEIEDRLLEKTVPESSRMSGGEAQPQMPQEQMMPLPQQVQPGNNV